MNCEEHSAGCVRNESDRFNSYEKINITLKMPQDSNYGIYVCMYVCVCVFARVRTWTYTYTCIYIYTFKYLCSHIKTLFQKNINSMELSPSWEVTICSVIEEFPTFYIDYRVNKSPPLVHILSQNIQSIPLTTISLIFILILSSHLRLNLPSGLFPSGFPTKTL
jgi:hypothetical protein